MRPSVTHHALQQGQSPRYLWSLSLALAALDHAAHHRQRGNRALAADWLRQAGALRFTLPALSHTLNNR